MQSTCCKFSVFHRNNNLKAHKFTSMMGKVQQYLFRFCCRMIKCLTRGGESSEYFEAPIINSLCLLKRNNLITRLSYKYKIFRYGFWAVIDFCVYMLWATMYTNHHLHTMLNVHQSISLQSLHRLYWRIHFMMKHYSRHYCLIKYWFFIMNETWILIFSCIAKSWSSSTANNKT